LQDAGKNKKMDEARHCFTHERPKEDRTMDVAHKAIQKCNTRQRRTERGQSQTSPSLELDSEGINSEIRYNIKLREVQAQQSKKNYQ